MTRFKPKAIQLPGHPSFLSDRLSLQHRIKCFWKCSGRNDHGPFCGNGSLPHSLCWLVLLLTWLSKAISALPQMLFLLLLSARADRKRSLREIWEAGVKQGPLHTEGLFMVGYGKEIPRSAWGRGKAGSSLTLFSSIPLTGLPPDFTLTSRGCGHV